MVRGILNRSGEQAGNELIKTLLIRSVLCISLRRAVFFSNAIDSTQLALSSKAFSVCHHSSINRYNRKSPSLERLKNIFLVSDIFMGYAISTVNYGLYSMDKPSYLYKLNKTKVSLGCKQISTISFACHLSQQIRFANNAKQ